MRPSSFASAFAAVAVVLSLAGCTNEIGVACGPGKLACDGVCVSISDDAKNCGGCGIACPGEIVCISGQCTCPKNQTNCSDVCVRTDRDHENCGSCGNACDAALVCSASTCAGSCPTNQVICDGGCVNTDNDNENCGACGVTCDAGASCVGGECSLLCENNLTVCGSDCVDTNNDPAHCGECNNPCASGEFCAFGICVPGCPSNFTLCVDPMNPSGPQRCVDTQNDPNNCGGCGTDDVNGEDAPHICVGTDGVNSQGVCSKGKCAYICAENFAQCTFNDEGGPERKPGEPYCETNTAESNCNCGGCNIQCNGWFGGGSFCGNEGFSEMCCDAMCQPRENFFSDTSCGSCGSVTACDGAASTCCEERGPMGEGARGVCSTLTEARHCGDCGNDCSFVSAVGLCCDNGDGGVQCRDGAAVDNCGACDNACADGNACCVNKGFTGASCTNLDTDVENCGACGTDCATVCGASAVLGCGGNTPGTCDCDNL